MDINFHGAAGTVTGSCYEVVTSDVRFLVDCGMFQGEVEELSRRPFPFKAADLDYVLLTHAHIDHSGLIPRLAKNGFTGTVLCTSATLDLCGIMLPDSGHIQEVEAQWRARKGPRQGLPPFEPLYTENDALRSLSLFRATDYDVDVELSDSTRVRYRDAGHILGSAFLELTVTEGGQTSRVTFSGDLGNVGQPIIRDPQAASATDVLLIESTYGDRNHDPVGDRSERLATLVKRTVEQSGNLIIPSFAVGRTQDVIYELVHLMRAGRIPTVPIYVDSPLATSATGIYNRHTECFDPEILELLRQNPELLHGKEVRFVRDAEESKSLNAVTGCIIISASGMCEVGRILHHLKHNLWRPQSAVLFVGYQAQGTLGRRLQEGAAEVRIFGEPVRVHAHIESIGSFSAHADQSGLLAWMTAFPSIGTVFLIHGEAEAQKTLQGLIEARLNLKVGIPTLGSIAQLKGAAASLELGREPLPHRVRGGKPLAHGGRNEDLAGDLTGVSKRAMELAERIMRGGASPAELDEAGRLTEHMRGPRKRAR